MSLSLSNGTRRRTLLGVVGLVFVTAGCLGAPGTEVDKPSAVADEVESRYERLDRFQATMIQRIQIGNETTTGRATVVFDKGDSLTAAYHTGPNAGLTTVIENPTAKLFTGEQSITEREAGGFYGTVAANLVRENEVVFEKHERIEGRPTIVFSISPLDEAAETQPQRRVWIDAERMVPLRIESTWFENGQRIQETFHFENILLKASGQIDNTGTASTSTGATP